LLIAATLFVVVQVFERLQHLRARDRADPAGDDDPQTQELRLLTDIRNLLQVRVEQDV